MGWDGTGWDGMGWIRTFFGSGLLIPCSFSLASLSSLSRNRLRAKAFILSSIATPLRNAHPFNTSAPFNKAALHGSDRSQTSA